MPIEEEDQIVSLGDSRIERVRGRLAIFKVRVYSGPGVQL